MATIRGRRNTKSKRRNTKSKRNVTKRRNTKSKRRNTKSKRNGTKGGAKNILLLQGQNPMHPQKYTKGECSICLTDIYEGGDFVETECKHTFHAECFLSLCDQGVEKQNCPLCRAPVKDLCTEIKEHLRKANSKKANRGG
jgi:hypothetical protein